MVKVLRKYNKYILVVGGSLLMVAFLMPQAVQQLAGSEAKQTYAVMDGKKVTRGEMGKSDQEYHALERFSSVLSRQILGIENSDHWFLLSKMADDGGYIAQGGDDSLDWPLLEAIVARQIVESQFGENAQFVYQQPQLMNRFVEQAREFVPQMRKRAAVDSHLEDKEFDVVLSKARGVLRMIDMYRKANVLSDRRMMVGERTRLNATAADCLVIPAQRLASKVPDPTEEELKAHFERFRVVKRGSGEFGVGYTLPARVKLEWLTLDRAAISAAVNIDPVEANKRWRTNRDKYKGDFAAEKARIDADLRAEKVAAIVTDADSTIRAELSKATRKLEADKTYKKLPSDWSAQRPSLEKIAEQIAASIRSKHGVDAPLPTVTTKAASWLTREDIERLNGIGAGTVRVGTRTLPLPDVIFLVKELLPEGQVAGTEFGLQVGVTSPDMIPTNNAGDRFYFTVLDVRSESPADALDEVRAEAITDYKRVKAFEILTAKASEYRELAVTKDLEAVAKLIDEEYPVAPDPSNPTAKPPVLSPVRNVRFFNDQVLVMIGDRPVRSEPELDVPAAREAVLRAGEALDPTKPALDTPAGQRTLTVPLPAALSLAIIEITARVPMTREMVRTAGERTVQELQNAELRDVLRTNPAIYPFSSKSLADRYSYKIEKSKTDPSKSDSSKPEPEPLPLGG